MVPVPWCTGTGIDIILTKSVPVLSKIGTGICNFNGAQHCTLCTAYRTGLYFS